MEYDLASIDYILETTRSVRKRLDLTRQVDNEVIMRCLEIAIQAPSASNMQNWKWLIVTDSDKKARIGYYYKKSFDNYIQSIMRRGGSDNQMSHDQMKLSNSATYLAENMGKVPMMIFACVEGRVIGNKNTASFYGSIIPATWSLMLAMRARGIGAAWTTLHLDYEQECNEILGIPDNITTAAMLPVAYFTGETFKKAKRTPVREITYWESWGCQQ